MVNEISGGLEDFFLVNLWLIYISGWWFQTFGL